jgi:hypothetical protein
MGRTYPMLLVALAACRREPPDDSDEPVETELACPREPTGDVPAGDANGDGAADLADAVVILRAAAEGGPAPACPPAADLVEDDRVELDDGFSLLLHLYEGGFGLPEDPECVGAVPHASPECSAVEARITGNTVELRGASVAIEGWSLAVRAEGCTIVGATTAGTVGASVTDDPPGARDLGYDATFVADEGAVSAVILGFLEPVALPAGAWSPVLSLTLEPGDSCDCTLSLGEPVTGLGEPVENLVVAGGAAWPIAAAAAADACE